MKSRKESQSLIGIYRGSSFLVLDSFLGNLPNRNLHGRAVKNFILRFGQGWIRFPARSWPNLWSWRGFSIQVRARIGVLFEVKELHAWYAMTSVSWRSYAFTVASAVRLLRPFISKMTCVPSCKCVVDSSDVSLFCLLFVFTSGKIAMWSLGNVSFWCAGAFWWK